MYIVDVGLCLQRLYNWQFVNQHRLLLLQAYMYSAGSAGAGLIFDK